MSGLYVDDILLVGNYESLKNEKEKLENEFELTVNSELNEYVGCQMKIRPDSIFFHQSKLIKKIYSEFNEDLKSIKFKKKTMNPGKYITSPDDKMKIYVT